MRGADPAQVSDQAKKRQRDEMGTLGSGNHYLEVQHVAEIYDAADRRAPSAWRIGDVVVSIHCGSRGLGHQIGTEFLREMVIGRAGYGIELPDRELACAPIDSPVGRKYLGAMRAAINCALANRQILTHLRARGRSPSASRARAAAALRRVAQHLQGRGARGRRPARASCSCIARAPRAPSAPAIPTCRASCARPGQPVLIGGSMGTASYILAGVARSVRSSPSARPATAPGARMSRHQATRRWHGRSVVDELAGARHPDPQPVAARRRRGGAGRVQGRAARWSMPPTTPGWRARSRGSCR